MSYDRFLFWLDGWDGLHFSARFVCFFMVTGCLMVVIDHVHRTCPGIDIQFRSLE